MMKVLVLLAATAAIAHGAGHTAAKEMCDGLCADNAALMGEVATKACNDGCQLAFDLSKGVTADLTDLTDLLDGIDLSGLDGITDLLDGIDLSDLDGIDLDLDTALDGIDLDLGSSFSSDHDDHDDHEDCSCDGGSFCNNDRGPERGACERCARHADVCDCFSDGLPGLGVLACAQTCFAGDYFGSCPTGSGGSGSGSYDYYDDYYDDFYDTMSDQMRAAQQLMYECYGEYGDDDDVADIWDEYYDYENRQDDEEREALLQETCESVPGCSLQVMKMPKMVAHRAELGWEHFADDYDYDDYEGYFNEQQAQGGIKQCLPSGFAARLKKTGFSFDVFYAKHHTCEAHRGDHVACVAADCLSGTEEYFGYGYGDDDFDGHFCAADHARHGIIGKAPAGPSKAEIAAKEALVAAKAAVTTACARRSARAAHVAAKEMCDDLCETNSAALGADGTKACEDACQMGFDAVGGAPAAGAAPAADAAPAESAACTQARKKLVNAEQAVDQFDSDSAAATAASLVAVAVAAAAALF